MNKISEESFQAMITLMEKFMLLSIDFKRKLKAILYEVEYEKGIRILNCRELQGTVWLMIKGIAREVHVHPETLKEKTTWFWEKGSFLYTVPGFFDQQPAESAIELITEARLIFITYEDFSQLKKDHREAEILSEKIRSAYEKARRDLADDIQHQTTKNIYLKYKPIITELLKVALQKDVAEYLGMTSDTLGRLRKMY
jgi:CRP-like cAMP-binding protein